MIRRPNISCLAGLLLAVLLAGCQPTVYLMPTPAVMATGEVNPFVLNPDLEESNRVEVLFATNRVPMGDEAHRSYTVFPGDDLRLGVAHLSIGREEVDWGRIFELSTSDTPEKRPAWHLDRIEEMAVLSLEKDADRANDGLERFFRNVNQVLARSVDKDIMVYVHGANSSIYRATAQAAQYRHFTGRNSLVLAFLWPSAENLLAYGTDVRHARRSGPAFKRLLTLLAAHTRAENINVLAYSAGAQIASPGLAGLGRETAADRRAALRLGEVYFAAADVGTDAFLSNLKAYLDIPRSVTLAVNMNDAILAMAERHHGVSRIGRPSQADVDEASAAFAREASGGGGFDIIGVDEKTVAGLSSGAHNFWYAHPWISSDVLIQFLFHEEPDVRGLVENRDPAGLRYWTFPPDYPDRIIGIIRQAKAEEDR
jgi:esterase/lipase superfamily enzyme